MINEIIYNIKKYKNRDFFNISNSYYTYEQLGNRIVEIQQEILKHHTKKPIVIIYDDNFDTYASILAILFLGVGFVPINHRNPIDRNKKIIDKTEAELIINTTLSQYSVSYNEIKSLDIIKVDNKIVCEIADTSLAYIFFTSGSTGEPKGVPIRVSNLNTFLNGFNDLALNINYNDKFLQMFELSFDLSVFSYLYPLTIGACVYTVPNIGLKYGEILKTLTKKEITIALMVPSIINYLKPYFKQIKLPHLKYSLFCGEALIKDVAVDWNKCIPNAITYNVYGPTEATIFCTSYKVEADAKQYNGIVSIGKPMKGTELSITTNNIIEGEFNNDSKGELIIIGNQVADEYFKNKSKTLECFFKQDNKNSYRTGDICFVDGENDYFYVGRIDSQVQIQGFRVELSEIEHAITINFNVNSSVITVENNTKVIAFVDAEINTEDVLTKLKNILPSYMIPKKIVILDKLPLNNNGKIDKKKLKEYAEFNI